MNQFHQENRTWIQIGAWAAGLALSSLLIGGTTLAMMGGQLGQETPEMLRSIGERPWPFALGFGAITLISLFDLFTVPALYITLRKHGRVWLGIAVGMAIVGDLLGIIGSMLQTALVPIGLQFVNSADSTLLTTTQSVETIDGAFTSAGFILIGISFLSFGVALFRSPLPDWIGWVAIIAGIFSAVGQVPALAMLFLVANFAYLLWYIGIGLHFIRMLRAEPSTWSDKSMLEMSNAR